MKRKLVIEVDTPEGEGDVYITLLTPDATVVESFQAAKHLLKQIMLTAQRLPDPAEKRFFTDLIAGFELLEIGATERMNREKAARARREG